MAPRSMFISTESELAIEPLSFGLLNLFLGDPIRTPEVAWQFLTVQELVNLGCVSKSYRQRLHRHFEYTYCRDGKEYKVPWPGYPGLLQHNDTLEASNGNDIVHNEHNRAGLYPHQLASLKAMHQMENSNTAFGSLRGGVLGDAPGLGKTITTLALISSTAGRRPVNPPEFWESSPEGWTAYAINPNAREEILKSLRPIRRYLTKQELSDLSPPFGRDRFPTMKSFEVHLKQIVRDKFYPRVSLAEWELVRQSLLELRIGMDRRNRSLMSSASGKRLLWERRLIRSSATLLVVPDALYEHWFQQIQKHLYLPLFADYNTADLTTRGVVYLDGLGDLADVTRGATTLENTRNLNQRILSAPELAGYLIVIVTFSRCRDEVRLGHAENITGATNDKKQTTANKKQKTSNTTSSANKRSRRRRNCAPTVSEPDESTFIDRSPLLKLRWLRLMIDEGHQLETDEYLDQFINQVAAERRWVVSGTPLTGNEDDVNYNQLALDQLQRILYFLRHPNYGISKSNDVQQAWETEVKEPFVSKKSRTKLLTVLKEIMVMHRKQDLKLPKPNFLQIEREVDIPAQVEARITATATNYGSVQNPYGMFLYQLNHYLHSPEFQSLVDDAQARYIVECMQMARENLRNNNNDSQSSLDRRPIKGVVYSSSNKDLLSVSDSILRKTQHENVAELYHNSKIGDMSAELERFRHGNRMYRECPICKGENATINASCDRYLMEVVSIQTKRRYLIEPERILRTHNVPLERLGGEPMKHYPLSRSFWRVDDELVVDIRENHPLLPRRRSFATWQGWGANKCFALADKDNFEGFDWFFGPLPNNGGRDSSKPIEMEFVLKKWLKCGVYHRPSRWFQGPKLLDTSVLKRQDDCYLLCLDAKLAHGLDLSFVTHIFLLEPINDAALLEQVTSRAHRLGATGPVSIQTIHVFYKCSDGFQQKLEWGRAANEAKTKRKHEGLLDGDQNRKALLNTVVCSHCYRPFDSKASAEKHERTLCPQNPDNNVQINEYHLSSVYKEIRPPLPMVSSLLEEPLGYTTTT